MSQLYRLSAFTTDPAGGNPAGVWIGEQLPDTETMQEIAAEVGFSETAFVAPTKGAERTVRYFSPEAEVPFCGHATIATGVQLGKLNGEGTYRLQTSVGEVPVVVGKGAGDQQDFWQASLTSVEPRQKPASDELLNQALAALDWTREELAPELPPVCAYAGAWHLVLAAATRERLVELQYDFENLKSLMLSEDLTTLQLVWRQTAETFHSRNPFPVGGVVEDPATGAAAAAFGGYLRDAGLMEAPGQLLLRQGETMGRPSRLRVEIPAAGGIVVTGTGVSLD